MKTQALAILAAFAAQAAAAEPVDISAETENIIVKCPGAITLATTVAYPSGEAAPHIRRASGAMIEQGAGGWPANGGIPLKVRTVSVRKDSEHPSNGTRVYELACGYGLALQDRQGFPLGVDVTTSSRFVRTRGECRPDSQNFGFLCEPGAVPPAEQAVKKFKKGLDEVIQQIDPD